MRGEKITFNCSNCNAEFQRYKSQLKQAKAKNLFCCKLCYNQFKRHKYTAGDISRTYYFKRLREVRRERKIAFIEKWNRGKQWEK